MIVDNAIANVLVGGGAALRISELTATDGYVLTVQADGTFATEAPASTSGSAPATVSSASATLSATDTGAEITVFYAAITLASAGSAADGHRVLLHNPQSATCLVKVIRAGSDTIDGATSRAGWLPPGGSAWIVKTSSSAWTSTLSIDPRPCIDGVQAYADAATSTLVAIGSNWTSAGTPGLLTSAGRTLATASRSSSSTATGWLGGQRSYYSDGRAVFGALVYISNVGSAWNYWVGSSQFEKTGTRVGWTGNGMMVQFESGDSNWKILVNNGTLYTQDSGVAVATGYYLWTVARIGGDAYWVCYYSATDATFAGVTPTVGSFTPGGWPSAASFEGQVKGVGTTWTGTIGAAWFKGGALQ